MSKQQSPLENPPHDAKQFRFIAGLYNFDASAKTATFYIMNTSRNRNKWGVTEQALDEAAPTLKGKPIGMGKGYRIDKHYPDGETMDSGIFIAYEHAKRYLTATAKITDPKTVDMMKKGDLGPVSVVIEVYRDVCSKCGEDLKPYQAEWAEHECIKNADAYSKVESFKFLRVDFVDVPAYPQAGLLELAAQSEDPQIPLMLFASFYQSQAQPRSGLNQNSKNQTKGARGMPEKTEFEFEEKMAALEQANQKLTADLADAVKKAADADKKIKASEDTVAQLKAQLDQIQQEKHDALVAEVLAARLKAGLVESDKQDEEKQRLAKYSNEQLADAKMDALKVAQLLETTEPPTPKTRYGKNEADSLLAAVNKKRAAEGLPELKELF